MPPLHHHLFLEIVMEPKIRYSKAMDTFIGGNRYFVVSVTRPMNGGIKLRHWEIWKKDGEKVVEILPYGNLNSYSRAVAQFKEVCRNAELTLALAEKDAAGTLHKGSRVESALNGEHITIIYADEKSVFLQGEDSQLLRSQFNGEVPTFHELYKSGLADEYREHAK